MPTTTKRSTVPVISTLVTLLQTKAVKQEGMTVPQLVSDLHKKTGRPEKALFYTVRAQLSRLPGEKKIRVKKVRDGANVRYSAPMSTKRTSAATSKVATA